MEVSGQIHPPAAFIAGERVPVTHFIGGWAGPKTGLDKVVVELVLEMKHADGQTSLVIMLSSKQRILQDHFQIFVIKVSIPPMDICKLQS
jgi:hypothetical protein